MASPSMHCEARDRCLNIGNMNSKSCSMRSGVVQNFAKCVSIAKVNASKYIICTYSTNSV